MKFRIKSLGPFDKYYLFLATAKNAVMTGHYYTMSCKWRIGIDHDETDNRVKQSTTRGGVQGPSLGYGNDVVQDTTIQQTQAKPELETSNVQQLDVPLEETGDTDDEAVADKGYNFIALEVY